MFNYKFKDILIKTSYYGSFQNSAEYIGGYGGRARNGSSAWRKNVSMGKMLYKQIKNKYSMITSGGVNVNKWYIVKSFESKGSKYYILRKSYY